jgi:hypothetical protein
MPWTDDNAHDPGITTLELLAYAITALGAANAVSRRVRQQPCGWPCAALLTAGAAGVAGTMLLRRAQRAPQDNSA